MITVMPVLMMMLLLLLYSGYICIYSFVLPRKNVRAQLDDRHQLDLAQRTLVVCRRRRLLLQQGIVLQEDEQRFVDAHEKQVAGNVEVANRFVELVARRVQRRQG